MPCLPAAAAIVEGPEGDCDFDDAFLCRGLQRRARISAHPHHPRRTENRCEPRAAVAAPSCRRRRASPSAARARPTRRRAPGTASGRCRARHLLREEDLDFIGEAWRSTAAAGAPGAWPAGAPPGETLLPVVAVAWQAAQARAELACRPFVVARRFGGLAQRVLAHARSRAKASRFAAVAEEASRLRVARAHRPPRPPRQLSSRPALAREAQCGQPSPNCAASHDRAVAFAASDAEASGLPACWCGDHRGFVVPVNQGTPEYVAVTEYFLQTLSQDAKVTELLRVQNESVFRRFAAPGPGGDPMGQAEHTLMFHGCRSHANEESILREGFQVSRCTSGGSNYGTWCAYNAQYSNGGFVREDATGMRHIFVCVASRRYVVVDNATMRVVGQDCVYPLWLLRYRLPPPAPRLPAPPPAPAAPATSRKFDRPRVFFEVRGGAWVPVTV